MHHLLKHIHQWALINDILSKYNKLTQPALAEVYRNTYAPRGMDAGSRCAKHHSLRPSVQLTMCDCSMKSNLCSHTGRSEELVTCFGFSTLMSLTSSVFQQQLMQVELLATSLTVNVIKEQSEWIWYDVLCFEIIFFNDKIIIRFVRTACSHCACSIYLHLNIFSHLCLVC